jgi:hypothetical protein
MNNQPRNRLPRWVVILTVCLVSLLACSCIFVFHGIYETTHDLPNPYWGILNTTYTYDVAKGPPGKGLVAKQPEDTVRQYITDYISIAGTFPCYQEVSQYTVSTFDHHNSDPVLQGLPCSIHRKVTNIVFTTVYIAHVAEGPDGTPAYVSVRLYYSDETFWSITIRVGPLDGDMYFKTYIRLDCWTNDDIDILYVRYAHDSHRIPFPTTPGFAALGMCNP